MKMTPSKVRRFMQARMKFLSHEVDLIKRHKAVEEMIEELEEYYSQLQYQMEMEDR